jgi:hypothetical protein
LKRKALALLLVVVIVFLIYLYTLPPSTVLSIDRIYNVNQVGNTVLVNATLTNAASCTGWALRLDWDPYVVGLATGASSSFTEGPFLKDAGATHFVVESLNTTIGEAVVIEAFSGTEKSASGTGVILTINFTVVHLGTTTIEIGSPSPLYKQATISEVSNPMANHVEISGLITEEGPPPVWTSAGFQNTLIGGEIVVLLAASGIVYWRTHPRSPRSLRRQMELHPVIDSEDQGESS